MIQNLKQKNNSRNSGRGTKFLLSPLTALLLASASMSALAIDIGNGLELTNAYMRGGAYTAQSGMATSGYQLGGELQHFRLGNEGDEVFEVLITETVDLGGGVKWKLGYMPQTYSGNTGGVNGYNTQQAYVEMTGLDIAPEAKFWGGQRRLRIQDVHIVDNFLMDYGMNYGAGMTDLNLGPAKLGVGVFNSGSSNSNGSNLANNARRINVDLSEIHTNPDGVVRLLSTVVSGNFAYGKPGGMLTLSHNQSNFMMPGLTNSLFLQTSTGHANLQGQFEGLGDAKFGGTNLPGVKRTRIADSIAWQAGNFGGQAIIGLENWSNQEAGVATSVDSNGIVTSGDGVNNRDFTLGGRVSYALTNNFKLLLEAANTSRATDGQATQNLNKITFAPTLSLGRDFWSRPEMRFYVTHANWNQAAASGNATLNGTSINNGSSTGTNLGKLGVTSANTAGIQIEGWF